ncbi:hypothetical protein [Chryseolinea sp. H1M3-3]|uniref:hypothetical protein n=1 Tax=Chryseolinea sp. H1M3-3 TaxID=3034144 RepID=UPI0023ED70BC|nr:hypothetical protein [Chryseolinea sp. H1M3-3]
MGKITNNRLTSSFSGQFSDDVVFRQVGNKTFFARKGVNEKPPTPAQTGNRNLFAQAQNYASRRLEDPKYSEWYTIVAKVNGLRSAQIAAVKDFMSKPEIDSLNTRQYRGTVGDVIHIKPKMFLKIEKINVTIYGADGTLLEAGAATKSELNWKYRATTPNAQAEGSRVVVVAYDRLEKSCTVVQYLGS